MLHSIAPINLSFRWLSGVDHPVQEWIHPRYAVFGFGGESFCQASLASDFEGLCFFLLLQMCGWGQSLQSSGTIYTAFQKWARKDISGGDFKSLSPPPLKLQSVHKLWATPDLIKIKKMPTFYQEVLNGVTNAGRVCILLVLLLWDCAIHTVFLWVYPVTFLI